MAPKRVMKAITKPMKAPMKAMKATGGDDGDDADDASQTGPKSPMKAMKAMKAMKTTTAMKAMKTTTGNDTDAEPAQPKPKAKAQAKAVFPDIKQLEGKQDKQDSENPGKEDDKDDDIVVSDEEDEEEEVPEGQEDTRATSRAQRHVFQKYFGQLPDEVQDAWHELRKPGGYGSGKQEKKNAIINACVARNTNFSGPLDVKKRTLDTLTSVKSKTQKERTEHGFTRTDMECKYGEALFNKGITKAFKRSFKGVYEAMESLLGTF